MITGFNEADFAVFEIPGLEPRMTRLIEQIRPKLHAAGERFAPTLSTICGEEMFAHVAKHARRTVHPPKDTWVAWANQKRGYKALPHFQIGLWQTHIFIQFTIIYECRNKSIFARNLAANPGLLQTQLPKHYYWSLDHMKPDVHSLNELDDRTLETIVHKLEHQKNAEFLCGLQIQAGDPILADGDGLTTRIEHTFQTLLPLYRASFQD